tara:strand:- start:719 stop:823 length:105 start_codon:yes stop_codon:yes gene_type:complete
MAGASVAAFKTIEEPNKNSPMKNRSGSLACIYKA